MAQSEIIYVAVNPLDNPGVEQVKAVAEIIGKDAYQTRLLLAGSIPRIAARCVGAGEAEAMGRRLREAGLTTIIIRDDELRKPFNGVRAQALELGDREVKFLREDGSGITLKSGAVFMIIRGTRRSVPVSGPADAMLPPKPARKLNVSATLMLGGIPVFTKQKPGEKKPEPTQPEWFLRLYERRSPDAVAEILQYGVDYSFLGDETSPSSMPNFLKVVDRLRKTYPLAVYDERLMKPCAVDIPMTTPEEDIDINCRLIYFQHLP